MGVERIYTRRRVLIEGAVFALACVSKGCSILEREEDSIPDPSIRFTEIELATGIWHWRDTVPPEIRQVIDKELMWGENLLVHAFLGHIPKEESRGGKSTYAKQARRDGWCTRHPESEDIPWRRNWDLMYDPQAAAYWEARLKIPHPIEVGLHHELFGHILPALRDPSLTDRIKSGFFPKNTCRSLPRHEETSLRYRLQPSHLLEVDWRCAGFTALVGLQASRVAVQARSVL